MAINLPPNQLQFSGRAMSSLNNAQQQQQQIPLGPNGAEQPSIAIIHQLQNNGAPPVAVMATGKHPIHLVVEHQRRQLAELSSLKPATQQHTVPNSMQQNFAQKHQQSRQTPGPMVGVIGVSQKANQPMKYSAPLVVAQSTTSSTTAKVGTESAHSNAWRIFNTSLLLSEPANVPAQNTSVNNPDNDSIQSINRHNDRISSTSPMPSLAPNRTESQFKNVELLINSESESKPTLISSLKQPSAQHTTKHNHTTYQEGPKSISKSMNDLNNVEKTTSGANFAQMQKRTNGSIIGASTKAYEPTSSKQDSPTRSDAIDRDGKLSASSEKRQTKKDDQQMRTIEITAQQQHEQVNSTDNKTLPLDQSSKKKQFHDESKRNNQTETNSLRGAESPQLSHQNQEQKQKREELVIASINNLTRIAFGNQLRHTVKVINQLIDQQAGIFSSSNLTPKQQSSAALSDPMFMSESKQSYVNSVAELDSNEQDDPPAWIEHQHQPKPSKSRSNFIKQQQTDTNKRPRTSSSTSASPAPTTTVTQNPSPKEQQGSRNSTRYRSRKQQVNALSVQLPTRQSRTKETAKDSDQFSEGKRATSLRLELRRLNSNSPRIQASGAQSHTRSYFARSTPRMQSLEKSRSDDKIQAKSNDAVKLLPGPMTTINDLSRNRGSSPIIGKSTPASSSSSPWIPSSEPLRLSTWGSPKLASHQSSVTSKSYGTTSIASSKYPWLTPERSLQYRTTQPTSDSISMVASELKPVLVDAPPRKSQYLINEKDKLSSVVDRSNTLQTTTKKLLYPTTGRFSESPNTITSKKMMKMDSLTTLKLSLLSSTTSTTTSTPMPTNTTTTTIRPLLTTQQVTDGTQSRWIPKTMFEPRTSSASALPLGDPVNKGETSTSPSTTRKSISPESTDNMASESISRYTTHHLMNEEMLATTRYQQHQQNMLALQTVFPQIAQTGDFFSAETIASWPEKYQTMIQRQEQGGELGSLNKGSTVGMSVPSTTLNIETTRRNGEHYDEKQSQEIDHSALARHKLTSISSTAATNGVHYGKNESGQEARKSKDNPNESLNLANTIGLILANSPGITILPSNHKLTAETNDNLATKEISEQATSPMMMTVSTESPTPLNPSVVSEDEHEKTTTVRQTFAPYTLVGLEKSRDLFQTTVSKQIVRDDRDNGTTVSESTMVTGAMPINNVTMIAELPLKPPYHAYDAEMLALDPNQNKPSVARKFYDDANRPSRNQTVEASHQQRFNLSALRYLAKNLLSRTNSSSPSSETNLSSGRTDMVPFSPLATQDYEIGNNTNYYELFGTLNGGNNVGYEVELPNRTIIDANVTSKTTVKSFFERAGNLLNDLRQMEQKRAAALLAAIRYQVPGPLFRPWDAALDLGLHSQRSLPIQLESNERRLDAYQSQPRNGKSLALQIMESLLLKSSLLKQRLIGREELEARFNSRIFGNDTRRSDEELNENDLIDFKEALESTNTTKATQLDDDLERFLADHQNQSNSTHTNSGHLLDKLIQYLKNNKITEETLDDSKPQMSRKDFETIDLALNGQNRRNDTRTKPIYPKYIHMMDYQTAWTKGPSDSRLRLVAPSQRQAASQIAAKLQRIASSNTAVTPSTEVRPKTRSPSVLEGHSSPSSERKGHFDTSGASGRGTDDGSHNSFDCTDRTAGFYPDIRSSCRVSVNRR